MGPRGCPPIPEPVYSEPWRPWFHFTPEQNWMNDPNGLVFFRGEYHLFYQHQPEIPFFGPMHRPEKHLIAFALALSGLSFFCWQTAVLDAVVWP